MQTVAELTRDHTRGDTFDLRNDIIGERMHTVIAGVHPIPAAISRGVGDIVSALRGILEHTVLAEVEHAASRRLTESEEQSLEVPAHDSEVRFNKWVRDNRRRALPHFGVTES